MIQTRGLTKDFVVSKTETVHAVRGIDLDIAPGELVAVLGPQRRRQVDDDAHAHDADPPDVRHRDRRGRSTWWRSRRPSGTTSATSARATAPGTSSAPATS